MEAGIARFDSGALYSHREIEREKTMDVEVVIGRYSTNEYFVKIGEVEARLTPENFAKAITGMGGVMATVASQLKPVREQVVVRVNGGTFRCDCGCNVFTKYGDKLYECNSCHEHYNGE